MCYGAKAHPIRATVALYRCYNDARAVSLAEPCCYLREGNPKREGNDELVITRQEKMETVG